MQMADHYILVGQTPVPIHCDPDSELGKANLLIWAREFEGDRRVKETFLWFGLCRVSTVFLGLDHNFHALISNRSETPILFETMAFWRPSRGGDSHCERCSTWLEAEEQHDRVVKKCRSPWAAVRCLMASLRDWWRFRK